MDIFLQNGALAVLIWVFAKLFPLYLLDFLTLGLCFYADALR